MVFNYQLATFFVKYLAIFIDNLSWDYNTIQTSSKLMRNLKGITIMNLGHEPPHDSYGKPQQKGFIFIQEALTFYYKHLFYLARKKCKELNLPIKKVFTYKGTIKVFVNSQKTIDILCEDDIQKVNLPVSFLCYIVFIINLFIIGTLFTNTCCMIYPLHMPKMPKYPHVEYALRI